MTLLDSEISIPNIGMCLYVYKARFAGHFIGYSVQGEPNEVAGECICALNDTLKLHLSQLLYWTYCHPLQIQLSRVAGFAVIFQCLNDRHRTADNQ